MNLKIGDKVRIIKNSWKVEWNFNGRMNWTIGQIGTIVNLNKPSKKSSKLIGSLALGTTMDVKFANSQEWFYSIEDIISIRQERLKKLKEILK